MSSFEQPDSTSSSPSGNGWSRRAFLACGALGGAGALLVNGFWHEPSAVRVSHLILESAKLRAGQSVRVAHISDLHIRSFEAYHQKVIDLLLELGADVIVMTGDYLEEQRNLEGVRHFCERLRAPSGIFAVQGNWEYWARVEGDKLRRAFARWGARLLINERADLADTLAPCSILGLDYPSPTDALESLQAAADPARFNLLLSHVPAFAHERLDGRIDLILAGHTHGGQVRLPWLPPLYLPRFSEPYVAGSYQVGSDTLMYVSRGIGTSLLPVRLLCPPEITLFELRSPIFEASSPQTRSTPATPA